MAKKKSTHQHKSAEQPIQQEEVVPQKQTQHKPPSAMDDLAEKLENVKSLNTVLLKETAARRKEVNHLLESKKSLESDLTRSSSEIESLKAELAQFKDVNEVGSELEREVVSAFLGSQIVDEMRKEIRVLAESNERMKGENKGLIREKEEVERRLRDLESGMEKAIMERNEKLMANLEEIGSLQQRVSVLCAEIEREREAVNQAIVDRDALEQDLKLQLEKTANESREELIRMEGAVTEKVSEVMEMRIKYEESVKVCEEREREIDVMTTKMEAMEGDIRESREFFEYMKMRADEIAGQKAELERVKTELISKISELEEESRELHNAISSLKEEEARNQFLIREMEKSNAEAKEREEGLKRELSGLLEEKKVRDQDFEKLMEEKSMAMKSSDELAKELENAKQMNQELIKEKNVIDQAKTQQENQIAGLRKELVELQHSLSALQESSRVQGEKNSELLSQMRHLEESLNQTNIKRAEALQALDQEKLYGAKLREEVSVLLKKMEEAARELEGLRMRNETLEVEKKELENLRSKLMEEKALAENKAFEAQQELDNLKCRMKSKDATLENVLAMLKNTAMKFSAESDNGVVEDTVFNERNVNGELEAYEAEVEAVRSAMRSREVKVEEMKQKVESLECSITEVRKRKSFWTMVSSATAVFAAVMSFAYASRVR